MTFAEYIWLDGSIPTQNLRSKTRLVSAGTGMPKPADFPDWGFDGSSTGQADGSDADCALRPVCVVLDPMRGGDSYLVLCEVFKPDGLIHPSNTRGILRTVVENGAAEHGPRRWWDGHLMATVLRDVATRYDGMNEDTVYEHFRQTYSVRLDGASKQFFFGILSGEERDTVRQIHGVCCGPLAYSIPVDRPAEDDLKDAA